MHASEVLNGADEAEIGRTRGLLKLAPELPNFLAAYSDSSFLFLRLPGGYTYTDYLRVVVRWG